METTSCNIHVEVYCAKCKKLLIEAVFSLLEGRERVSLEVKPCDKCLYVRPGRN